MDKKISKYLHSILTILLATSVCASLAQQSTVLKSVTASTRDQWDLNKYVWSHTRYQTGKNDKPVVDFEAIDNNTSIRTIAINSDGKYVACDLFKGTVYTSEKVVVQSVTNDWKRELPGISPGFFSSDGKHYVFRDKENLCFLKVGQNQLRTEKGIASIKQDANGKNDWLAYQLKDSTSTVKLENLSTGKQKQFEQVNTYSFEKGNWFSCTLKNEKKELVLYNILTGEEKKYQAAKYLMNETGSAIILQSDTDLRFANLLDGKPMVVWSKNGQSILSGYSVDKEGRQVSVVLKNGDENEILYWQVGMDNAVAKANGQTKGLDGMNLLSASFSDNGNYLLLTLQKRPDNVKPGPEAIPVDIWSYKDSVLQSAQASLLKRPRTYQAVLNLTSGRILYCEQDYEYIKVKGDVGIVERNNRRNEKKSGDRFWEKDYDRAIFKLISLKDGSLIRSFKITPFSVFFSRGMGTVQFSPDGRYLLYFDGERGCNFFSIDLQTGKEENISIAVPAWQLGYKDIYQRPQKKPIRPVPGDIIEAWLEEEEAILVYDNYDIWQLDLAGKKPAVNITNGYGRRHHIKLERAGENGKPVFLPRTKELLIKAFNRDTKYNGYYKKALGVAGDPELLYMGPCFMTGQIWITDQGMEPLKALGSDVWVVKRQTATEAPNYFLTTDFKSYQPVTNFQPQQQYNWYTTELHSFKQLDGTMTQGILYKPENFDPAKKYPVIINFYGQLSQNLYWYRGPDYIDRPNIMDQPAWLVSHGYLVFLPDIYFTDGEWGPSTVNTVEGAAKYVSTLPFVDARHIGATGHSNSGRFGFYLLTHSTKFSAMAVGEGTTDIISNGLKINSDDGTNSLEWAEKSAFGSGLGVLWENKKRWMDHASVLSADRVSSPLLLFDNKVYDADGRQAAEMYLSLRRLDKKCWWLHYKIGGHVLSDLGEKRDFTIRYTQFFDHYLKGAPAPRWMTQGIPAKLKGIDAKYELDPGGSCAMEGKTECAVCKKWNEQYKSEKSKSPNQN